MTQKVKNVLFALSIGFNVYLGVSLDKACDLVYTKDNQINQLQGDLKTKEAQISNIEYQVRALIEEQERISAENHNLRNQVSRGSLRYTMECTAYTHTGNVTASGVYPVAGRTVASNDFPLGTKLRINGNIYVVEDTGGMGNGVVDIFMDSHAECVAFGRQTMKVEVVR